MYTPDQMMAPQAPPAPDGASMSDMQKMKLLQAMQAMNAHQPGATTAGGATANALAQGLTGYMQGLQMQKMMAPAAAPTPPIGG